MEFLDVIYSIIFGIIEGITEWLPISSTGHLIIANKFIHFNYASDEFIELYDVIIQLGAVFAVFYKYFDRLNPFKKEKDEDEVKKTYRLWLLIFIGVLPSCLFGLFLDELINEYFFNSIVVCITLIIYGFIFIVIKPKKIKIISFDNVTIISALLIGFFQVLSLIPGTSRSGITILICLLLGFSKELSCEYSFLLGLPTILGASILKFAKFIISGFLITTMEIILLIIGILVSFVVSLIVINFLIKFVSKNDLKVFGFYRIILGLILILFFI